MARYTYDDASVGNGLDYLANAKSALYNTKSDISKALQTINLAGKGYMEYSVADAASIVENDLDSIDSITKEIASTAADLAYYFDHPIQSAIGNLFGTIDMALFNLLEGAGSGIEGIFDGILTIAGWGSGLVGWDGAQDFLSGVIEKDYVGDFFDYQYESGALKSVEFYSAYSHDSGVAEVIKGFGTAAAYVGIGIATSGALAADIGFTYLGEQGRKTQTSLQSGKSFDEAAKDGFKAGLFGAAAAGAGNFAGGLLSKQFGKVVDKFHPTPSNATSAIASSADDVAKAGTKIDDALGAASKVDDVTKAADDLSSAEKALNEGNIKYKAGEITDADLGKLEVARDTARTKFENLGGNSDDLIGAAKKLDNAEKALNEGNIKYKAGEITEKDLGKLEEVRDAARADYNKVSESVTTKAKIDPSAEGATKVTTENSGKYNLEEVAKDGPIMKDHEGASSVGETISNNTKSNASSLTEKANSVSKLDSSVDEIAKPVENAKSGSLRDKADMVSRLDESAEGATKATTENSGKYNLEEVAKDGPIMKDHEGASSVGETISNNTKSNASSLTEKANSVSKLDSSVDEIAKPAGNVKPGSLRDKADMVSRLDESAAEATSKVDDVTKAANDLSSAEKALNEGNIKYKAGEITDADLGKLEVARDTARTKFENLGGNSDDLIGAAKKLDNAEKALNEGNIKYKAGEITEKDLGKLEEVRDAARADYNKVSESVTTKAKIDPSAEEATRVATENSGKYNLEDIAKDGPIMKDHEGASSAIKAADNQPDINTPMDAEYTVLEHPANAAKADDLASAANKADINTPIDAEYTVLEPSINGRTIGNRIGTGTATGLNAARQNLSNNNIETLYANEPNSNDYRFDNLSNNGDTTSIENIGGTSSEASTPSVESPQVTSQPSPTGNNSTIPSNASSAYSTYSTVGTMENTGSSVQYRVETQSTPSSNTSIATPEINTPTQTVPDTGGSSTIPGSNTGNGGSNSGSNIGSNTGSNTDTTVPGGSTTTPTVPETPSTNPGDGISGGITTPEEPVPGTPNPNPPTDNVGGNITDIADNITGGTGGSTTGNYNNGGSSYGNSIIGGFNNNGSQLGPEGELSYENKPDSGILDGNDSMNTIDKGNSLDVISIDKDTPKNPSTSSGGSSVIPTILGVGAAGAAGVAGIHYVQKKFGKDNEYYEDEEETDQENNDDKNTDNYNIIEPENDIDDITSPSEIEIKPPKYKAGSVNQLKLDDGANIKINEDKSIIAPQNEELE